MTTKIFFPPAWDAKQNFQGQEYGNDEIEVATTLASMAQKTSDVQEERDNELALLITAVASEYFAGKSMCGLVVKLTIGCIAQDFQEEKKTSFGVPIDSIVRGCVDKETWERAQKRATDMLFSLGCFSNSKWVRKRKQTNIKKISFWDATTIERSLIDSALLNTKKFKKNKSMQAVIKVAATYFANKQVLLKAIAPHIERIVKDCKNGRDKSFGIPIQQPVTQRVRVSARSWAEIQERIILGLLRCGKIGS